MSEIDEETLRLMSRYCGGDPRVPRRVEREALRYYGEENWSLDEFLAEVATAVSEIPAESRATATVELRGGYEESTRFSISYQDDETPEEVAARVERAWQYARGERARERATYEALKKKFG